MEKAARVATSGLLYLDAAYPARGPASWHRRSESLIVSDSAFDFTTPSSRVRCNIPGPSFVPRMREPKFPNGCYHVYVAAWEGRWISANEKQKPSKIGRLSAEGRESGGQA